MGLRLPTAIVALLALASCGTRDAPPHIVLLLSDDLGVLDTTLYGSRDARTPNLERLAGLGMTFDRAFVASPACAPSRAALLTGLMPARNGAEANHTYPREGVPYLTVELKELGYEIAAFGKVPHGRARPEYGFDLYSHPRVGFAENVREFLRSRDSGAPLLLMVGDRRPHVPWSAESTYGPAEVGLPPYFIDTPETREHRARYFTDIAGLDGDLGQVMELAATHLDGEILYLFSSDHGGQWPFGKWNLYDAGIRVPLVVSWDGRIEPGVRTDAMVSWIDIFPTLIDLAGGTVPAGLDGQSFADVLAGESAGHRREIFTTHSGDGPYNVYPIRSIRTARYKYILNLLPDHLHSNHSDIRRREWAGAYWDSWDRTAAEDPRAEAIVQRYFRRPSEELYDLLEDPLEQVNLAGSTGHREIADGLRVRLEQWMEEQGDARTVFNDPYPASGPRPTFETIQRQSGAGRADPPTPSSPQSPPGR